MLPHPTRIGAKSTKVTSEAPVCCRSSFRHVSRVTDRRVLPEGVHFEGEPVVVSVEVTNPLDVIVYIEKMRLYGRCSGYCGISHPDLHL